MLQPVVSTWQRALSIVCTNTYVNGAAASVRRVITACFVHVCPACSTFAEIWCKHWCKRRKVGRTGRPLPFSPVVIKWKVRKGIECAEHIQQLRIGFAVRLGSLCLIAA
jgi:hypothetical protein